MNIRQIYTFVGGCFGYLNKMIIPLLSSLGDNSPVHIPTQFMIFDTLWWLIVKYIQISHLNF